MIKVIIKGLSDYGNKYDTDYDNCVIKSKVVKLWNNLSALSEMGTDCFLTGLLKMVKYIYVKMNKILELAEKKANKKLNAENTTLKKKLAKLVRINNELDAELTSLREKAKVDEIMKSYVTTRSTYVQTDKYRPFSSLQTQKKDTSNPTEEAPKVKKLMSMHNSLMRRYEKELKINMEHTDVITQLSLKANDLELKLQDAKTQIQQLEKQSSMKKKSIRKRSVSPRPNGEKMQQLLKENEKLRKDNEKFCKELKGLDQGFFDEVEDLKYGLMQSAKLNQEYEKTLHKLCKQFGVPYPYPETQILK